MDDHERMEISEKESLSVLDLVFFVHNKGDITYETSAYGRQRRLEGVKWHQKIQKDRASLHVNYEKELSLASSFLKGLREWEVRGRLDGCWFDEIWHLEEIKSLGRRFIDVSKEDQDLHWAQLQVYAALFFKTHTEISKCLLHLCYVEQDSGQVFLLEKIMSRKEAEDFFSDTLDRYVEWFDQVAVQKSSLRKTSQSLSFPFPEFRKNQWKMSACVYKAIQNRESFLIQAPTGIGKTISTLFPAIKSFSNSSLERIFYLTSKTEGQSLARNTLDLLRNQNLAIKDITLTAKSKICFTPGAMCAPEECSYAKGYFAKRPKAIHIAFSGFDSLTRERIEEIARQEELCPFELSLDLAQYANVVICDVNYIFDPRVQLQRFCRDHNPQQILLVDEAHNFPDRARSMYSAVIHQKTVKELLARIPSKGSSQLKKSLKSMIKVMQEMKEHESSSAEGLVLDGEDLAWIKVLQSFRFCVERGLRSSKRTSVFVEALELYFEVVHFLQMNQEMETSFKWLVLKSGGEVSIELFCLDPSPFVQKILNNFGSGQFFSATLSPPEYYSTSLSDESMSSVAFSSPFPIENQLVLVADFIPTSFQKRQESLKSLAHFIEQAISLKTGNYIVFLPSYQYLENLATQLQSDNYRLVVQSSSMSETERQEFLNSFFEGTHLSLSTLGLAVMGGGFSEGIDFKGDALIGAFVVSVGLPGLSFHRDLLKKHYDKTINKGFDFAYRNPGATRVVQSAGRVIRSETDRGFVCLIDPRFTQPSYKQLLPVWWRPQRICNTQQGVKLLKSFWEPSVFSERTSGSEECASYCDPNHELEL